MTPRITSFTNSKITYCVCVCLLTENTIIIEFKNCSEDKVNALSDLTADLFLEEISEYRARKGIFSEEQVDIMKTAVKKSMKKMLENGLHVVYAKRECLLLKVKCDTLSSFVCLIKDCLHGQIHYEFQVLFIAVKSIEGFEETTFQTVFKEEEIIESIYTVGMFVYFFD